MYKQKGEGSLGFSLAAHQAQSQQKTTSHSLPYFCENFTRVRVLEGVQKALPLLQRLISKHQGREVGDPLPREAGALEYKSLPDRAPSI